MNKSLSIQAKILLGMAILVVGYLASAAFGYYSGAQREGELAAVEAVSVPVTLQCQSAVFAFEASTKTFTDALMTGEAESLKGAADANGRALEILVKVSQSADSAGLTRSDIEEMISRLKAISGQRETVYKGMSGDAATRSAIRPQAEKLTESTESLRRSLSQVTAVAEKTLAARLSATMAATRQQRITNLWMAAIIVVLGSVVMYFIVRRSIVGPISRVVSGLRDSSEQVAGASQSIRGSGQQIADSSSAQAASLEETSATLEEISSGARSNAEHSANVKNKVSQARAVAEKSTLDVNAMRAAMSEIQTASNNIAKIVKTIDEIAFQTNILALNAAVEAARAGEAGAGFAVVAEEVRSLAQRCAEAARETASMIDDTIAKSERGVQMSSTVATGLEGISQQIQEIDGLVAEIAQASHEQSTGVNEVNKAVVSLNGTTQANAATAEEAAATVEELAVQVEALHRFTRELNQTIYGGEVTAAPEMSARHEMVVEQPTLPALRSRQVLPTTTAAGATARSQTAFKPIRLAANGLPKRTS